jgi:hypothetical protein
LLTGLQQRAHLGRRHPVVGGAGVFLRSLQMKVRSSTRATSLGSLQARKLFGRLAGLSFLKRAGGHQLLAQAVVFVGR